MAAAVLAKGFKKEKRKKTHRNALAQKYFYQHLDFAQYAFDTHFIPIFVSKMSRNHVENHFTWHNPGMNFA
jgi:hypothetical protein